MKFLDDVAIPKPKLDWEKMTDPLVRAKGLSLHWFQSWGAETFNIGGDVIQVKAMECCDPVTYFSIPTIMIEMNWNDSDSYVQAIREFKTIEYVQTAGAIVGRYLVEDVHPDYNNLTVKVTGSNDYSTLIGQTYGFNGYYTSRHFHGAYPIEHFLYQKGLTPKLSVEIPLMAIGGPADILTTIRKYYQAEDLHVIQTKSHGCLVNTLEYSPLDYYIPQHVIYNRIQKLENQQMYGSVYQYSWVTAEEQSEVSLDINNARPSDFFPEYGDWLQFKLPSHYSHIALFDPHVGYETAAGLIDGAGQVLLPKDACLAAADDKNRLKLHGQAKTAVKRVVESGQPGGTYDNDYCWTNHQAANLINTVCKYSHYQKLSFEMRNEPYLRAGMKVWLEYPNEDGEHPTEHAWRVFYISKIERTYKNGSRMKLDGYLGDPTGRYVFQSLIKRMKGRYNWTTIDGQTGVYLQWQIEVERLFQLLGCDKHTSFAVYQVDETDSSRDRLTTVPYPTNSVWVPMYFMSNFDSRYCFEIDVILNDKVKFTVRLNQQSAKLVTYGHLGARNASLGNPNLTVDWLETADGVPANGWIDFIPNGTVNPGYPVDDNAKPIENYAEMNAPMSDMNNPLIRN